MSNMIIEDIPPQPLYSGANAIQECDRAAVALYNGTIPERDSMDLSKFAHTTRIDEEHSLPPLGLRGLPSPPSTANAGHVADRSLRLPIVLDTSAPPSSCDDQPHDNENASLAELSSKDVCTSADIDSLPSDSRATPASPTMYSRDEVLVMPYPPPWFPGVELLDVYPIKPPALDCKSPYGRICLPPVVADGLEGL
ncbi:hypothetical protein BDV98DRAFT_565445 [Pterulicium gracile]|uniref:Uncharacterized protein n=1 Tax=Pterulicium gracile TaxID=1884261 RepID=A0A5C3QMC4_9AGAR|nr:hypothetical protein BDV98DRAFT_565445 [Pterula gracilis]